MTVRIGSLLPTRERVGSRYPMRGAMFLFLTGFFR